MLSSRQFAVTLVVAGLIGCKEKPRTGRGAGESPVTVPVVLAVSRDRCVASTTGTVLGLQALLAARKHPALAGVRRLDLPTFCTCYFAELHHAVGAEKALAYAESPNEMAAADLVTTAAAADEARLECAGRAIPAGGSDRFAGVFAAPFRTGHGLGGVEIGIDLNELRDRLGETSLKTSGRVDRFRYGENGIELVVDVFPSGPTGRVAGVRVNRSYGGVTDRGFRIGDRYDELEQKAGTIVFRQAGRMLLTADGTKYIFSESGILDGIAVVTADSDPLMRSYGGR